MVRSLYVLGFTGLVLVACHAAREIPPGDGAEATPVATAEGAAKPAPMHLGGALANAPPVALADIAKTPGKYDGQVVTTRGTITAVCQQAGCWMEIKDAANAEAHVRLAGHAFSVPRSSAGHQAVVEARVLRTDAPSTPPPGAKPADDCEEEAAKQTGKPVPKVELEATAVDLT